MQLLITPVSSCYFTTGNVEPLSSALHTLRRQTANNVKLIKDWNYQGARDRPLTAGFCHTRNLPGLDEEFGLLLSLSSRPSGRLPVRRPRANSTLPDAEVATHADIVLDGQGTSVFLLANAGTMLCFT